MFTVPRFASMHQGTSRTLLRRPQRWPPVAGGRSLAKVRARTLLSRPPRWPPRLRSSIGQVHQKRHSQGIRSKRNWQNCTLMTSVEESQTPRRFWTRRICRCVPHVGVLAYMAISDASDVKVWDSSRFRNRVHLRPCRNSPATPTYGATPLLCAESDFLSPLVAKVPGLSCPASRPSSDRIIVSVELRMVANAVDQ